MRLAFGLPWRETDASAVPGLMGAVVGNIERLTANGGDVQLEVYEAASRVGAKVVIPPRKDATLSRDPLLTERNNHIEHQKRTGKRYRAALQSAGFVALEKDYRPPGTPRDEQPGLASVWRQVAHPAFQVSGLETVRQKCESEGANLPLW